MDYFRVWVFTLLTWKSIEGLISIKGYGSLKLNSNFVLACQIISFEGTAEWSTNNMASIICTSGGFCTTVSKDNFKFSGNSSGIFVIINPVLEKDDHMKWTCFHGSTNTSYTIEIRSTHPTGQTKSEALNGGEVAGIVIGCVIFIALLCVLLYFLRRTKTCCFS